MYIFWRGARYSSDDPRFRRRANSLLTSCARLRAYRNCQKVRIDNSAAVGCLKPPSASWDFMSVEGACWFPSVLNGLLTSTFDSVACFLLAFETVRIV